MYMSFFKIQGSSLTLFKTFKYYLGREWIKFIVPILILIFTTIANLVEAKSYYQEFYISTAIDPATKTFILGELDKYTPIIEERRDIDRINISEEGEEFVLRKPTLVYTEITPEEKPADTIRSQALTHVVQSGETLSTIGFHYGLKIKTLLAANQNLKNADSLGIADKILIPTEDYDPTYADKLIQKKTAKFERQIASKTGKTVSSITKTSSQSKVAPGDSCVRPVDYRYVSRRLNAGHRGVDMIANTGSPIYAACSGRIVNIAGGWSGGFGLHVKVAQNNGDESIYAHMSSVSDNISVGSVVEAWTYLGGVGSTGRSTGPHLHFE